MPGVNSTLVATYEWLLVAFGNIIVLIQGGKRTSEELRPLKEVLQAVIDGKSFKVVFPELETIKDLCLSWDPAEIWQGWQQLYQQWGLTLEIPEVPYSQERIRAEKKRGRILIFVHESLAGRESLPTLGKLSPAMASWSIRLGTDVTVDPMLSSWLFVESSLTAPNRNITEGQLRKIFAQEKATGYGLSVYIIFALFCKEVFGSYPDIHSQSRLLGSSCSYTCRILTAGFGLEDNLDVDSHHYHYPEFASDKIGGRSAVTS